MLAGCWGPRVPGGPTIAATSEDLAIHLTPTTMIDSDHPAIRSTAQRVVGQAATPREQAVALHDFVRDEVLFGFQDEFYDVRASEVLSSRKGYCNTKSTLFIALLRARGIPARQRFVDIDSAILRDVISTGTQYVDHSYTEVWLDGRWVRTDSYIVDRKAFVSAQARLQTERGTMGYGVHRLGTTDWDGTNDAFAQFVWTDRQHISKADFGVHADTAAFYRDVEGVHNRRGLFLRVFGPTAFRAANAALDDLRRETTEP